MRNLFTFNENFLFVDNKLGNFCVSPFWQQVRTFPMKFIKIKHIVVSSCHYMDKV